MSENSQNENVKEAEKGVFSHISDKLERLLGKDDIFVIEECYNEKPSNKPLNIVESQIKTVFEQDNNRTYLSLRTHFCKKDGDLLYIDLLVDNSTCMHLTWSSTMEILVKNSDGELVSKHDFTDTISKDSVYFKVKEWIDVFGLSEGKYTLYLCKDSEESYISDLHIVKLPFPYTEYAELLGLALFRLEEGDGQENLLEVLERGTQSCFNAEGLDGVFVVLQCGNLLDRSYDYQLITRIYNELGTVVVEDESHGRVEPKKEGANESLLTYSVMTNEIKWERGSYKLEFELFGEIVAVADFVVGDRDLGASYNNKSVQPKINIAGKDIILGVKDPMKKLNSMIGLEDIKLQVAKMVSKVKLDDERKMRDLPTNPIQMHCAFLGNPGTGKTTVAKLLGQTYKDLGLLSKGHVVLEERSTLMTQNWGSEGDLVNKAIERAKGGILFIDEAYDLVTDHPSDPGRLIISSLLSALADEKQRDWMLILAGYPKQMEKMLNANPGFRSRLNKFHFKDYNKEELMQVADLWLTQNCYTMSDDARSAFESLISTASLQRDEHFGNARFVFNLLENEIQTAMALRVLGEEVIDSEEMLTLIEKCDIPNLNKENGGEKAIEKLNSMVGLSELKTRIEKHLSFVRFINARRDSNIFTVVPPMHMVFTGNPGTGKTSVADYLGEIYKSVGILSVGNVIKVSRSDIVGNHVGDTEKSMETLLSAAKGNILFIDEAYTLFSSTDQNDFGKRAIEVLLDTLSRESLDMVVIMAGYPKEMEQLLHSNPGLKGRFPYLFHFEDYSENELLKIAKGVVEKNNLILSKDAEDAVMAIIIKESRTKDANFSNARLVVRLITTQIMPNMAHRIFASDKRDELTLKTVLAEDVPIKSEEVEQINDNLFDENALAVALGRLDSLVGLSQVKRAIHEFVEVARMLNGQKKKFVGSYPLKWSFAGNTGTGKSTVAEILSDILKAMHLLGRGHVVEVKAEELYATTTYQADEILKKRMQESQQGLLFVDGDAAQFCCPNSKYDPNYLRMCLATNTANMPGTYAIVIAEYESPRQGLVKNLAHNGITDFDHTLIFDNYTADELLEILKTHLKNYEITLDESASQIIKAYIDNLCTHHRSTDYANARTMKLLARSIQKITLLNGDSDGIITAEEVAEFKVTKLEQGRTMGYIR